MHKNCAQSAKRVKIMHNKKESCPNPGGLHFQTGAVDCSKQIGPGQDEYEQFRPQDTASRRGQAHTEIQKEETRAQAPQSACAAQTHAVAQSGYSPCAGSFG